MKKKLKHKFSHPDPEKNISLKTKRKDGSSNTSVAMDPSQANIKKDLRRVFITIFISIALLIAFYYVNQKYNLLSEFGRLLNF